MPTFGVEARRRQAGFRAQSPTISVRGRSPSDDKGQRHGHLLSHGCEEENLYPSLRGKDGALRFFRERGIKWHRTGRSGDTRGMNGPTRNMASSQIACVNFLLPLCAVPGALAAAIRAIDDDVLDVVPIYDEGRESLVEIEWIGLERPLEEEAARTRGANVTSVDAFMVTTTNTGLRAYLMEWKYVEEYRSGDDKGQGKPGETRRRRYTPLYYADHSSFSGNVPMEELLYEPFYQIMRLRLLADRMIERRELGVSDARVVVVVPEENAAYRKKITSQPLAQRFPELNTVHDVARATLKRNDGLATIPPSSLVDAVELECGADSLDWGSYQRERYGW